MAPEQANDVVYHQVDLSFLPGYVWAIIFITGFIAFFVIMYVLICAVTSLRGWRSFASRYRTEQDFPKRMHNFYGESIMVGSGPVPANYRYCITGGYNDDGLYLKVTSLFRLFHPAVFFPWDAIASVKQKKAIKGHFTAVNFKSPIPRVVLFRKFGDAIFQNWQKIENKREIAA